MKSNLVLALAVLAIAGCDNSSSSGRVQTRPVNNLKVPENSSPYLPQNQNRSATVAQQPVVTQPVQTAQVTPAPTSKAGLNPAHGQPGHRCDISVGAPLDSKPTTAPAVNANPVTVTQNPATTSKTFTSNPIAYSPTKPGMNPEHGKPGHRCDIAVGAPLDSKPANTTPVVTNNATQTTSIPAPTAILPATNTTATADVTKPGMNPEHGKPGHRCDIAVGAPLDSKPIEIKADTKATEKKN